MVLVVVSLVVTLLVVWLNRVDERLGTRGWTRTLVLFRAVRILWACRLTSIETTR